jgi:Mg2+ and Co2+ transporter CorA
VFAELKSYTDPVGAALDDVNRQFDKLRTVFKEAGASAAEYAQLEQLLTIKRNEALQKQSDALDDVRSRIAEVQGDEATVKAIERAHEMRDAISDQVRAELQRLYAVEDATEAQQKLADAQQAAAAAAEQMRDAWKSIGNDLLAEVERIRGITGSEQGGSYAKLQARFNSTLSLARGGDQGAASKLVDLSQSLLNAAALSATNQQDLARIKAQTAAGLEGLYNSIGGATGSGASGNPFMTGPLPAQSTPGGQASVDAVGEMRGELSALRQELGVTQRQIVQNGSALNRLMSRFEATGFTVRTDADTPLQVEVV